MSENSMETLLEKVMDQNTAANKLLADIAKEREHTKRVDRWLPWVAAGIMVIVICITFLIMHMKTLDYFSQYEFYTEEVYQDTGEGSGNNVYFPGENATYNEGDNKDGE